MEGGKMLSSKITIFMVAACFGLLLPLVAKAQSCTMDSAMAPSTIDIPTRMETTETARVKVDVFNSGTCNWEPRKVILSVRLVRKPTKAPIPLEEFQLGEFDLRAEVPSRKRYIFHYEIKAPMYAGRYELEWTMTEGGKPFGMSVRKTIEVNVP
jgi:hypothetical protein